MATIQYIIVAIIIIAAWAYAIYKAYHSLKHNKDQAYGCSGCSIHKQWQQKLKEQRKEHKKVFSQKNGK